jgi:NAD(P)H-hydrate epimerase
MKILSAEQIRRADAYTIAHEPIPSLDLMERAAMACTRAILTLCSADTDFLIFCGMGNNGGDGLAIARLLLQAHHRVRVCMVQHRTEASPDCEANKQRLLQAGVKIETISDADTWTLACGNSTCIIDAMLGTGVTRATDGLLAAVISKINHSGCPVIAIDVPSGLPADIPCPVGAAVIRATDTLTFQQPKFAFLFAESSSYVGRMQVLDIGIDTACIPGEEVPHRYLSLSDIRSFVRGRSTFSHKGTFGHSLLIAGSYGKVGAVLLAARACMHSGTGLLTVHLPACGYSILQTALPEAMVSTDTEQQQISMLPPIDRYEAIGMGPGIGTDSATAHALKQLIQTSPCPLVLDADALNILAEHRTWLAFVPQGSVITPHPREFDRLTRTHSHSMERLESARSMAQMHGIYIVLKGAHTAIITPEAKVWFNSTGNPAMAKGGSGDVLTGIITSLIARGYTTGQAALLGVYLHGMAADIAVQTIHPEAFAPSQLIDHLSAAFNTIYGK